mgnify:CR=1 FL=1
MKKFIVTFAFTDDDGEYVVTKSKPISAENEQEAGAKLVDQFETLEGISCDVLSAKEVK